MKFQHLLLLSISLTFAFGCSMTRYSRVELNGEKVSFVTGSLGTTRQIDSLDLATTGTNKTMAVRGYKSDQEKAFEAGLSAGRQMATKALIPAP